MPEPAQCQQCGACCRHTLIIEATPQDADREPRIRAEGLLMDGHGTIPPDDAEYCLNPKRVCVFIRDDSRCDIYETRPDCCRDFRPGGPKCELARKRQFAQESANA